MKSWQHRLHFDCRPVSLCILLALCISTKLWEIIPPSGTKLKWRLVHQKITTTHACRIRDCHTTAHLTFPSQPVWVWSDRRVTRSPGWCASPQCYSSVSSWQCARRWGCHLQNSTSVLSPGYKLQKKKHWWFTNTTCFLQFSFLLTSLEDMATI